jgi:hypothetical protein
MAPEVSLRLAAGALAGQRLTEDGIRELIRTRFAQAAPIPKRPPLDSLVANCGAGLQWDATTQHYTPGAMSLSTYTRTTSSLMPAEGLTDAAAIDARLASAVADSRFLAVFTPLWLLGRARRALLGRRGLRELDVTALVLERLRALGYAWQTIVAADKPSDTDADFRSLVELVEHEVVPEIEEQLTVAEPILITEAAPLARYGQMRVLQRLADQSIRRPAGRILLVPARRPDTAMLDNQQVPLTSPASQKLWLPEAWINTSPDRTANT